MAQGPGGVRFCFRTTLATTTTGTCFWSCVVEQSSAGLRPLATQFLFKCLKFLGNLWQRKRRPTETKNKNQLLWEWTSTAHLKTCPKWKFYGMSDNDMPSLYSPPPYFFFFSVYIGPALVLCSTPQQKRLN